MPKNLMATSWEGIFEAAQEFKDSVDHLSGRCNTEQGDAFNKILLELSNALLDSIRLYGIYKTYNWSFAFLISYSSQILQIAHIFINLKPEVTNTKELEFARIYLDFLETLTTLNDAPEMPALLRPILKMKLPHLDNINDKDELFIQLCTLAIQTQKTKIDGYLKNNNRQAGYIATEQYIAYTQIIVPNRLNIAASSLQYKN